MAELELNCITLEQQSDEASEEAETVRGEATTAQLQLTQLRTSILQERGFVERHLRARERALSERASVCEMNLERLKRVEHEDAAHRARGGGLEWPNHRAPPEGFKARVWRLEGHSDHQRRGGLHPLVLRGYVRTTSNGRVRVLVLPKIIFGDNPEK